MQAWLGRRRGGSCKLVRDAKSKRTTIFWYCFYKMLNLYIFVCAAIVNARYSEQPIPKAPDSALSPLNLLRATLVKWRAV
jgi:hypothetical protein